MDNEFREKISLDELFTQDKSESHNKTKIYKKILQRVHNKIKLTSRQRNNMKCCWFVIPEFMLGLPKYDTGACTAYLMGKLEENGFMLLEIGIDNKLEYLYDIFSNYNIKVYDDLNNIPRVIKIY